MAVREFDGSDDVIRFTAPTFWGSSIPYTVVAVTKIDVNNAYQTMLAIGDQDSPHIAFEYRSDGAIEHNWNFNGLTSREETLTALPTGGDWDATGAWRFVASTLTPGVSAVPRFHASNGTNHFHGAATTTTGGFYTTTGMTDWALSTAEDVRIGCWSSSFNFFNGRIAMVAVHIGSALSDGAIEALVGGNKATYSAAGFDHLWELNQASTATAVEDQIGSLDQTSLTGTTVAVGDDPPSSVYSFEVTAGAVALSITV
jgi:hypothetical protein